MRICNLKTFNPLPSTKFLGECHQPTEQTLMENPGGSRKEPWLGFRRQNRFFFFFAFQFFLIAIKWVGYNGIKNYIHGLKSYASSKLTCFFWLIIRLMAEYNITQRKISHPVAFVVVDWHYQEINTLAILQWREGIGQ